MSYDIPHDEIFEQNTGYMEYVEENEKKNTRCIREDNEDIMYLQGLGNVTKFNIFCEIDD